MTHPTRGRSRGGLRHRAGVLIGAALLLAGPAAAAPAFGTAPGTALVIGNATYTALPALPGCALSAHGVAAALRRLGFHVIEQEDAALGQVDGALGRFSARLAAAPGAPGFVYLCGYAAALNDRGFFLPVSATLARPTDMLTQGVLLASVIGALRAVPGAAATVALDLAPRPGAPASEGIGIDPAALPAPLGLVAARDDAARTAPTSLATALIAGLAGPDVQDGPLIGGMRAALAQAGGTARVALLHAPVPSRFLAGAPSQAAASVAPAPAPAVAPASLPDEASMTDADRARVQTVLAQLGYYDGKIDGAFGPDTRAAIRRFQFELHDPKTGHLTAAEATRLVSSHPR